MTGSISVDPTKVKKLVVCCDGTWMDSDGGKNGTPSNVTRLARAIRPADNEGYAQIVYYQAGIGTGLGVFTPVISGGTGRGFSENIREAYAFLANNFHKDAMRQDQIYLIGFSRGAYTARSLGGLIGQLGLLKKESMCWFYDVFRDWQEAGNPKYTPLFWKNWSQYNVDIKGGEPHSIKTPTKDVEAYLEEYRSSLLSFGITQEVDINAIGVFDTVGALGIPVFPVLQKMFKMPAFLHSYKWVNTMLDKHVKNAFQALALDEHRSPFFPSVWEKDDSCTDTNLKQCWFMGPHSNVGGAYADIAAANITLAWMMDQLSGDEQKRSSPTTWRAKDWLEFDLDFLKDQAAVNIDYQRRKMNNLRSWGMGTIYNSLTFPVLLAGARTRRPGRTHPTLFPTEYQDTTRFLKNTNEKIHASVRARIVRAGHDFEPDPDANFSQKLSERIAHFALTLFRHLTKRVGKPYYCPQTHGPLKDWDLKDGNEYHDQFAINTMSLSPHPPTGMSGPPYWVYTGRDPLATKGLVIKEDELGSHELALLYFGDVYGDCRDWVRDSNRGGASVHSFDKEERRGSGVSQKRSSTI